MVTEKKPKIAIIGNGNVGSALEQAAKRSGYDVRSTGKDPKDVRAAGSWGEIIILAVPADARTSAIKNLGDIKGKILVDPTNLLNSDMSFAGSVRRSGAEEVQEIAEGARVVKAFNTVFAANMTTGKVKGEPISLFVAADDDAAKRQVLDFGKAIGFQTIDAGPLQNARWLETLGFFNIQLGYGLNYGSDIGIRVAGVPST